MSWQEISAFLHKHQEALALFAMSLIVTMRKELPWPLNKVPPLVWAYGWFADALMTFVSLKGPLPHAAGMESTEKTVKDGDHTESTKQVSVTGSVVPPEAATPATASVEPLAPSGIDRA